MDFLSILCKFYTKYQILKDDEVVIFINEITQKICGQSTNENNKLKIISALSKLFRHIQSISNVNHYIDILLSHEFSLNDLFVISYNQHLSKLLYNIKYIPYSLEYTFTHELLSTKPQDKRKCSVFFYYILLLSDNNILSGYILELHTSLISLLRERNQFIQDFASRSLRKLYLLSDDVTRNKLVANLSHILMTGEFIPFPECKIGYPPRSQEISSEKSSSFVQLTTAAQELGKIDLIYHFLALQSPSNESSLLPEIISDLEINNSISIVIPKLYRYLFDPNPNISNSIKYIWEQLNQNNNILKNYLTDIYSELLNCLNSSNWRSRVSACLGLYDLLGKIEFTSIEKYFGEMIISIFLCRDDINDDVRDSADKLLKKIHTMCLHWTSSTVESSKDISSLLTVLIPILLQNGFQTRCSEVQLFTVQLLIELLRNASYQICPFIPQILKTIPYNMSTYEIPISSLINTPEHRISDDELDEIRIQVNTSSPLSEILKLSIKFINSSNIHECVYSLLDSLTLGAGTLTLDAISKTIFSLLTDSFMDDINLRKLAFTKFIPFVNHNSKVIAQEYSHTISYLCKELPEGDLNEYISTLISNILKSKEKDEILKCIMPFHYLIKSSSIKLKYYHPIILPMIYQCMHSPDADIAKKTETIWNLLGLTPRYIIRLYFPEFIKSIKLTMDSLIWIWRDQGYNTLRKIMKISQELIIQNISDISSFLFNYYVQLKSVYNSVHLYKLYKRHFKLLHSNNMKDIYTFDQYNQFIDNSLNKFSISSNLDEIYLVDILKLLKSIIPLVPNDSNVFTNYLEMLENIKKLSYDRQKYQIHSTIYDIILLIYYEVKDLNKLSNQMIQLSNEIKKCDNKTILLYMNILNQYIIKISIKEMWNSQIVVILHQLIDYVTTTFMNYNDIMMMVCHTISSINLNKNIDISAQELKNILKTISVNSTEEVKLLARDMIEKFR